jgi:hypothetical protein
MPRLVFTPAKPGLAAMRQPPTRQPPARPPNRSMRVTYLAAKTTNCIWQQVATSLLFAAKRASLQVN